MRCLKKIGEGQKSGAGASKTPTCKLFDQLLFLRDFVSNRETSSNINLAPVPTGDIFAKNLTYESLEHQHPCPESLNPPEQLKTSTPAESTEKRKLELNDVACKKKPYGRLTKRADRQEQIDLLLVNALSKSEDSPATSSEMKSSDQLFCESIVEILNQLPAKKNRMARVEIQQILMKYEFNDDS